MTFRKVEWAFISLRKSQRSESTRVDRFIMGKTSDVRLIIQAEFSEDKQMSSGPTITRAIYPGSFDPVTKGHIDLIERVTKLFDEIIVAVADSKGKSTLFSLAERVDLIQRTTQHVSGVKVVGFTGLLIEFARQMETNFVVRGLRAVSDFEYEFQLSWMNRQLKPDIETLFFAPAEDYAFVAASLVKEIAQLGGDVSQFVHPEVDRALQEKLRHLDD